MSAWRFYIETFGCKVNQHESQQLREAWSRLGGIETDSPAEASHICINSCAITENAERDARNAVYRLKRAAPNARIILTGCAAQLYAENGVKAAALPQLDLCVPQKQKATLMADPFGYGHTAQILSHKNCLHSYSRSRPVVKVQDGCNQNCAFCIVPQTRGQPVSRAFADILQECQALCAAGFSEIVLSGINLRQYHDGCGNFWALLQNLDASLADAGNLRLRLSSLEPAMLNRQALEVLHGCSRVVPHLHLSLQHASSGVLKSMGRANTKPDRLMAFLDDLSQIWPVAAYGADILVGFPGEKMEDIEVLAKFVEVSPLTYAHVFPFSPRPGTVAANFDRQVEHAEKIRRAAFIREKIEKKHAEFIKKILQQPSFTIVLDKANPEAGFLRGINEYYLPCYLENATYTRKMLKVRPLEAMGSGLRVELLADKDGRER